jgi:hypothetical protein
MRGIPSYIFEPPNGWRIRIVKKARVEFTNLFAWHYSPQTSEQSPTKTKQTNKQTAVFLTVCRRRVFFIYFYALFFVGADGPHRQNEKWYNN